MAVHGKGSGEGRDFWRGHIEAQARSGLSIRGYCREQGFGEWLFYEWRRRLRWEEEAVGNGPGVNGNPGVGAGVGAGVGVCPDAQESAGALFARVRVSPAQGGGSEPVCGNGGEWGASSNALEVVLSGGRLVRVCPGFDGETLRRLVVVLEGAEGC